MIPGIELKALRKSLFFGTREAASLIGVTNESQWLKWESGAQEMPEAVAQAFCYVLDWRNEMLEKARKLLRAPKATQTAPLVATQTAPPGRCDLMH